MDPLVDNNIHVRKDETTCESIQYRQCSHCRKPDVPLTDRFKTCLRCREKFRIRNQKRADAKAPLSSISTALTDQQFNKPAKRNAEDTSNGSGGKEHKRARNTSQGPLNGVLLAPKTSCKIPTRPDILEYQGAPLLYSAAKAASSEAPLCNFSGRHSIVRCEQIDNVRRAKLVTNDLRKLVKLSFKHSLPLSRINKGNIARMVYSCTCKSSVTKGLSRPSGRKSTGAIGLSNALNSTQPNENIHTKEISCGGFIIVTAQDDSSHFLGIPGQQIIIQISH